MSVENFSKMAEIRLMVIGVQNNHQLRKLTIILQKFVKSSVQIVLDSSRGS